MRDLKPSDKGRKFSGIITGISIPHGKIMYRDNTYWLCQNERIGDNCGAEKFGYAYSWSVGNGSVASIKVAEVTECKLVPTTEKEIEEYTDFQIGDVLVPEKDRFSYNREVIAIIGDEIVITKDEDGTDDLRMNTKDKLYNEGWRLKYTPEEESIVELSIAEVATKLGIDPKTLKIVDKQRIKPALKINRMSVK